MKLTTLCYIEKSDAYLMLHRVKKQNDANQNKWIGVGGKLEKGESPEACVIREVKEETGLTLVEYRLRGVISFISDCWEDEYMYLYTANKFTGELTDCDEGELEWIEKKHLPDLNLWEGDRLFLKLLLRDASFFTMKLIYEGEKLVSSSVDYPKIKNIVLDMGNVLIDFKPEKALEKIFSDEEERKKVGKELFEGPEWIQGDLGQLTNEERFIGVSERLPECMHERLKELINDWQYYSLSAHPGAKEFIDEMKASGRRVFVLSNACDMFHKYFPRYYDTNLFEGIMVSSDVKCIKPDVEIYKMLMESNVLIADECLFVDDRSENVMGALMAGMQAVTFDGDFLKVKRYLENAEK